MSTTTTSKPKKDTFIIARTTSAEKQALEAIAEAEGVTVSQVVTDALKKVIRRRAKQVEEIS